jgi:DNA-binding NarL/FixJ family response regulator
MPITALGAITVSAHSQHRPLRVLVVDDYHLFRTGLRELLQEEGFEVAEAESGEAALRQAGHFGPDVVVMDLGLPGMSGIEATRRIREASPATRVVMLTMSDDDEQVLDAVLAGASGYLLKASSLQEITDGIRAVAAGWCAVAPRVTSVLVERIRRDAYDAAPAAEATLPGLSERERQVLALIAEGCDNAQIARTLYVSPSTVRNHVSSLLEKLGVHNRVQAAAYAVRHGVSRDEALSA